MSNTVKNNEPEYELIENPEALAARLSQSEEYVKKNKNLLIGLIVAIAVGIAGAFFYFSNKTTKEAEAQASMFQSVYYFEADSLNKALNGDGQAMGLLKITEEYSGTDAANMAHFYAGVALLKQGKYQDALTHLQDFSSDDIMIQARAYSLQGDAQMELGNATEAANLYVKAANHKGNKYFSPGYLMKAGLAFETAKDFNAAVETYEKIVTEYPESVEVTDAKKYKARAEGMKG